MGDCFIGPPGKTSLTGTLDYPSGVPVLLILSGQMSAGNHVSLGRQRPLKRPSAILFSVTSRPLLTKRRQSFFRLPLGITGKTGFIHYFSPLSDMYRSRKNLAISRNYHPRHLFKSSTPKQDFATASYVVNSGAMLEILSVFKGTARLRCSLGQQIGQIEGHPVMGVKVTVSGQALNLLEPVAQRANVDMESSGHLLQRIVQKAGLQRRP